MLYRVSMEEQDFRQAIHWLELLSEKNSQLRHSTKKISTDIIINDSELNLTLAGLYQKTDDTETALSLLQKEAAGNPDRTDILEKLVVLQLEKSNYQQAEANLYKLVNGNPSGKKYQELLASVLIKQQKFNSAINVYESIITTFPEDQQAHRRLIGLYAKTGDMLKAQELATQYQQL